MKTLDDIKINGTDDEAVFKELKTKMNMFRSFFEIKGTGYGIVAEKGSDGEKGYVLVTPQKLSKIEKIVRKEGKKPDEPEILYEAGVDGCKIKLNGFKYIVEYRRR